MIPASAGLVEMFLEMVNYSLKKTEISAEVQPVPVVKSRVVTKFQNDLKFEPLVGSA